MSLQWWGRQAELGGLGFVPVNSHDTVRDGKGSRAAADPRSLAKQPLLPLATVAQLPREGSHLLPITDPVWIPPVGLGEEGLWSVGFCEHGVCSASVFSPECLLWAHCRYQAQPLCPSCFCRWAAEVQGHRLSLSSPLRPGCPQE